LSFPLNLKLLGRSIKLANLGGLNQIATFSPCAVSHLNEMTNSVTIEYNMCWLCLKNTCQDATIVFGRSCSEIAKKYFIRCIKSTQKWSSNAQHARQHHLQRLFSPQNRSLLCLTTNERKWNDIDITLSRPLCEWKLSMLMEAMFSMPACFFGLIPAVWVGL
jgi:hypothetical protein